MCEFGQLPEQVEAEYTPLFSQAGKLVFHRDKSLSVELTYFVIYDHLLFQPTFPNYKYFYVLQMCPQTKGIIQTTVTEPFRGWDSSTVRMSSECTVQQCTVATIKSAALRHSREGDNLQWNANSFHFVILYTFQRNVTVVAFIAKERSTEFKNYEY